MKFGLRLPSYAWPGLTYERVQALGKYAARAEGEGFDSLWVIEHLLVAPDFYGVSWLHPLQVLASVAARTRRVQLGTGVLVLPLHHPVMLAKEVATLDYLSGGRFILGVGLGSEEAEFRAVGLSQSQRGARTDEALALLRQLLTESQVSFQGRFYQVENVTVEPRPPRLPPVWVGGGFEGPTPQAPEEVRFVPRVLRRIAAADGWLAIGGSDPAPLRLAWAAVQEYVRQEGGRGSPPVFGFRQFLHLSERPTREAALEEQEPHFRAVMAPHLSLQELAASYLMGTIDEIRASVAGLRDAGVQHLVLTPVSDDPRQIGLLRKHVLEPFRG